MLTMEDNLKVLACETSSTVEVLSAVASLDGTFKSDTEFSFGVSANITVNGFDTELKRMSFLYGHRPNVVMGNYRDHVGNAAAFAEAGLKYAIFLWFFDALLPGFGVRCQLFSDAEIAELLNSFRSELRIVLRSAEKLDRVFIPLMHPMRPGSSMRSESAQSGVVDLFNAVITEEASKASNAVVLDSRNLLARFGAEALTDEKMYFLYKNPYKEKFFYHLASDIFREIRGHSAYFKKVLILDCDNTLWRGIVGEDGISGIKLAPEDFQGNVFWLAQNFFISLQKRGVLLALCSKNDPEAVDEVLREHESCPLKDEHIVIKKVNWRTKVENITEIASELDLGLDSFVFVDDSDFECEAVRTALPQVTVFQVPERPSDYPEIWRRISELFPCEGILDSAKTAEYRLRAQVKEEAAKWETRDDYLLSLETKVGIVRNETDRIERIAELTQKTNQFNLTTRRYSEADISKFMNDEGSYVYSFHANDRFGSSGLIGVCIIRYSGSSAEVDTFLLSCRLIGRGIEFAVWGKIIDDLKGLGVETLSAEFIRTAKNSLVENFFDDLGFALISASETSKRYNIALDDYSKLSNAGGGYFVEVI